MSHPQETVEIIKDYLQTALYLQVLMEEFLNIIPCGFLVFDDGKIVAANSMLLKMLGYERDELLSLPIEKIFSVAGRIFYQTHFFPLLKLKSQVSGSLPLVAN